MVVTPADISTTRAETDSLLYRGRTLCRLSQIQTRQLVGAASKNAAKFDKELPCIRDERARAVNEILPLEAARAPQFASRRLVHYSVSPTRI